MRRIICNDKALASTRMAREIQFFAWRATERTRPSHLERLKDAS